MASSSCLPTLPDGEANGPLRDSFSMVSPMFTLNNVYMLMVSHTLLGDGNTKINEINLWFLPLRVSVGLS